jgi:predicted dehydrogenase
MSAPLKLAVLGAGAIGRRHIEHVLAVPEATPAAIVDPAPAARDFASACGVPWYPDFAALLAAAKPDGVIVATPNRLHVAQGLAAIAAGIPTLVEKPIADDVASATELVEAAEHARVPLAVGHHRRHNAIIQRAKAIIESGRLGKLVAVHGFFWLMKPDDYFDAAWRREPGAGPILINLIHDIDLLRHLCGEIDAVQAQVSNAVRGYNVEDTAAILLRFENGALGTLAVSDTAVAPWSFEQTSGENPAYPRTGESCYFIAGTHGSLTVPKLEVWSNPDKRGWFEPFMAERSSAPGTDPLRLQIQQFCRVIRGEEPPLVSGREGLMTLKVVEAIKRAAESGARVPVD